MQPRHVYVHVPFCTRRCSYCDFSIAVRPAVPVDEYLSALRAELAGAVRESGAWQIDTLYFGGGTPSRLGPEGIARLLELANEYFVLAPEAEVTLEANPEDVNPIATTRWRAAGINRVSLGAQSFDDRVLSWMHRPHTAAHIFAAVEAIRYAGIQNFSLDLIFSIPETLGRVWTVDVECALAMEPTHISLYGLTVEPATPLARWRDRGTVAEAPEERYEAEYLYAHDAFASAGYRHYEVSNLAQPGGRSRHNSAYWSDVPYAGFGPSAHRYDGVNRSWNVAPYAEWVRRVRAGLSAEEGRERLTAENREAEQVYLSLRTDAGLRIDETLQSYVCPWVDAGWAEVRRGILRLTPTGWLRLDALATALTARRSYC